MGIELVEGRDLVVDSDDSVYMKTIGGLESVHVIYRRVDDAFLDPELFKPGSLLGCPGLMRAWKRGTVSIVNAPGAGVADDKLVYSYVPELIRYYLDQDPILPNVPTFRLTNDAEREHVLSNFKNFVIKPANEAGGYGVLVGAVATHAELARYREDILRNPRSWVAQPIIQLSTAPTAVRQDTRTATPRSETVRTLGRQAVRNTRRTDTSRPQKGFIDRELITGWRQVLSSTCELLETLPASAPLSDISRALARVVEQCQRLIGQIDGSMSRDEAFSFLTIGRLLERADITSRVLVMLADVLTHQSPAEPFANVRWLGTLKYLAADQMFLRRYHARTDRAVAVKFLLFDRWFPAACTTALTRIEGELVTLPNSVHALESCRACHQTQSIVDAIAHVAEFADAGLTELAALSKTLEATYFHSPTEPTAPPN